MIQLLTQPDAEKLLQTPAEHPQLMKIQALLKAYGISYDFCRFYCQRQDGRTTAYLCKLDKSGILWAEPDFDAQEWTDFVVMMGISQLSVLGKAGTALQNLLQHYRCHSGNVYMKCNSHYMKSSEAGAEVSLPELFQILCQCFSEIKQDDFKSWYCDISHRIRHNVCRAFLYENRAAAIVLQDENTVIISQFCVLPEYRGQGIGRELMQKIQKDCGIKRFVVYSKDHDSDLFYQRIGFLHTETWFTFYR